MYFFYLDLDSLNFVKVLAPFYWENFVQKRLVHQGNLLNVPTCSGSLREIKKNIIPAIQGEYLG